MRNDTESLEVRGIPGTREGGGLEKKAPPRRPPDLST
jgi:hypothetical protein